MVSKKSDIKTKVAEKVKQAEVKKDVKSIKKSAAQLISDLRGLSNVELDKALVEANDDLVRAKKMLKANELPASHVIRQIKTKIARIHTIITENNKEAK